MAHYINYICIVIKYIKLFIKNIKKKTYEQQRAKYDYAIIVKYYISCLKNLHIVYIETKIENDDSLHLTPGQYVMLHSSCKSRPYTPINWTHKTLVLLIRVYKQGEFSVRLTNASIGSTIDVRGPYGDFKYINNRYAKKKTSIKAVSLVHRIVTTVSNRS